MLNPPVDVVLKTKIIKFLLNEQLCMADNKNF